MKKKIVFFTTRDLANVGGGERMLSLLANNLCESYSVVILTPFVSQSYYCFSNKIKIENFGLKYSKSTIFRKLQYLIILTKLRSYLRRTEIDRFIACSSMAITLTSILANRNDKRLIAWIHTSFYHPMPSYLRKIDLRNLHKFTVVTVNSMDVEQYRKYSKNVLRIFNPLPFSLCNKSNCNSKRIISVGRLEKNKGFDLMIDICTNVLLKYEDWILDIYGQDDGEKKKLEQLIIDNKMENRIRLHDPVMNIENEYVNSSIFITTSRIEAFSLVLLEACEAGLPCIAYDVPSGPRDIVQDGCNGYLVKDLDKKDFEYKLSNLIKSESLRRKMSRYSIKKASEFEITKIVEQWKSFL